MNALAWYSLVAPVYNLLNLGDRLYSDARRRAVQRLGLETGGVVVDLFCGTGVNFDPIREALGDSGRVIAVDGSAGMLARAEARVKKNGWPPEQFILLRRELRRVAPDFLNDVLATTGAPKVLSTHALTVFPDYEAVIRRLIGALPAGSRFSFLEGDSHSMRSRLPSAKLAWSCRRQPSRVESHSGDAGPLQ